MVNKSVPTPFRPQTVFKTSSRARVKVRHVHGRIQKSAAEPSKQHGLKSKSPYNLSQLTKGLSQLWRKRFPQKRSLEASILSLKSEISVQKPKSKRSDNPPVYKAMARHMFRMKMRKHSPQIRKLISTRAIYPQSLPRRYGARKAIPAEELFGTSSNSNIPDLSFSPRSPLSPAFKPASGHNSPFMLSPVIIPSKVHEQLSISPFKLNDAPQNAPAIKREPSEPYNFYENWSSF